MAKSLSGYGLPMSLVLVAPEYDVWEPGEHNGTFRGNAHAFVTATVALNKYWSNTDFADEIRQKAKILRGRLSRIAAEHGGKPVGRGLMQGLNFGCSEVARDVCTDCLENGMLLETCGPSGEVIKLLLPLNISHEDLEKGLSIIEDATRRRFSRKGTSTDSRTVSTGHHEAPKLHKMIEASNP